MGDPSFEGGTPNYFDEDLLDNMTVRPMQIEPGAAIVEEQPATMSPASLTTGKASRKTRGRGGKFPPAANSQSVAPFAQSLPSGNITGGTAIEFVPRDNPTAMFFESFDSASPSIATSTDTTNTPSSSNCDLPRRDAHMASEQRRRAIMKECYDKLAQLLPMDQYRKATKANILQASVSYIGYLQNLERALKTKIQQQARENLLLSQQLHGTTLTYGVSRRSHDDDNPPIAPSTSSRRNPPL
jgi:hypothetical protein